MNQPVNETCSRTLSDAVRAWLDEARHRLKLGRLDAETLDSLDSLLRRPPAVRQRLLYLTTQDPSPRSLVEACYLVEPVPGGADVALKPEPDMLYQSVHEALCDGWQVLAAPDDRSPVLDREIDLAGYTFILHKLEAYCDCD